ncbi:Oidioi.mRNA.OKI2018_I69.chr2.g6923.t1.cds [Oikopleura dioica]|uniref:Oidioi.mRNA.OKI2018_I69.chr2.g6923.t1.cds n=1 Tax=Oikopleura dioica TaxID=34765 RepID=A0ABN7T822_OIKDI|nr:Oidioi.mRNA.OKI2018_I69.chr2.g6923.t1.cds [Oikopleura dioica]
MWTNDPRPQSSSPSRRGSMPAHSLMQNKNGRTSLKPLNLSHISHAKDSGNISEDSPRTPPPSLNVVSLHSPGRSSRNRNRPFMINSSNSSDDNLGDYSAMSSAKSMADPNRSHSPEMKMSLLRKIQSKVLLKENAAASRLRRPPRRRRLKRLKTVDIKDEERAQDGYQSEILNDLYN